MDASNRCTPEAPNSVDITSAVISDMDILALVDFLAMRHTAGTCLTTTISTSQLHTPNNPENNNMNPPRYMNQLEDE
tara:strand:+ start:1096 stop:1326 length:231 start_codon:yes stop_codon:yes gene_type:complete